jgi:hypothetical protein
MVAHKWGCETPNGQHDPADVVEIFKDGVYVMLHTELTYLPRLRELDPEALILVRYFTPNWYREDPRRWARQCANTYARPDLPERAIKRWTRDITWANEQNLAHESGGLVGASPGRAIQPGEYVTIRDWNLAFLEQWKREPGTEDAILHFPALASGHSDDQDDGAGVGLEILRPVIEQCQVFDCHVYWHADKPVDDEWEGLGRLRKKVPFALGKPILVKETGNFAVDRPTAPDQYAAAARYLEAQPEVVGLAFFIFSDPTGAHQANDMSRNPQIKERLKTEITAGTVARPALWLPTTPVPEPVPEPVEPTPANGSALPWETKMLTVWNLPRTPQDLVSWCQRLDFKAVEIKVGDGDSSWVGRRNVTRAYVDALKKAGIAVSGWTYNYCDGLVDAGDRGNGLPPGEAKVAADAVRDLGLAGHTFDLEIEAEGHSDAVRAMFEEFKRLSPGTKIGVHTWAYRTGHTRYPWAVIGEHADCVRPMIYQDEWKATRAVSDTEIGPWLRDLLHRGKKLCVVWGITDSGATVDVLRSDQQLAEAFGSTGIGVWEYSGLPGQPGVAEWLRAVKTGPVAAPPDVDPVGPQRAALDQLWAGFAALRQDVDAYPTGGNPYLEQMKLGLKDLIGHGPNAIMALGKRAAGLE